MVVFGSIFIDFIGIILSVMSSKPQEKKKPFFSCCGAEEEKKEVYVDVS